MVAHGGIEQAKSVCAAGCVERKMFCHMFRKSKSYIGVRYEVGGILFWRMPHVVMTDHPGKGQRSRFILCSHSLLFVAWRSYLCNLVSLQFAWTWRNLTVKC